MMTALGNAGANTIVAIRAASRISATPASARAKRRDIAPSAKLARPRPDRPDEPGPSSLVCTETSSDACFGLAALSHAPVCKNLTADRTVNDP